MFWFVFVRYPIATRLNLQAAYLYQFGLCSFWYVHSLDVIRVSCSISACFFKYGTANHHNRETMEPQKICDCLSTSVLLLTYLQVYLCGHQVVLSYFFIVFFFWMPLEQSAVWMHCIYLWDTVLLQNVCLCSETKMRSEMLWEPRLDVHNISHMPLIRSVPWCFSLHDSPLVFPKGECWDLCLFMSVWCIRSIFIL